VANLKLKNLTELLRCKKHEFWPQLFMIRADNVKACQVPGFTS